MEGDHSFSAPTHRDCSFFRCLYTVGVWMDRFSYEAEEAGISDRAPVVLFFLVLCPLAFTFVFSHFPHVVLCLFSAAFCLSLFFSMTERLRFLRPRFSYISWRRRRIVFPYVHNSLLSHPPRTRVLLLSLLHFLFSQASAKIG